MQGPGSRWRPRTVVLVAMVVLGLAGCSAVNKTTTAGSIPTSDSRGARSAPPGPAEGPVPADFVPASVSFVSPLTGWVLGTVTCGSGTCPALARTRDGGKTWLGVGGPEVPTGSDRAAGVAKVRFADTDNGWVFGPDVWATHDGGAHWSRVALPGVDAKATVSDLGAASGVVHAAVIDSNGVHILVSPVGTDAWHASSTVIPQGAGPVPRAEIVLQGTSGWMIEVDRTVIGGARLSDGAWIPWQPPCGDVGGPAYLAASTPTDMVAVCDEGVWTGASLAVRAYSSTDAGLTFHPSGVGLPLSCCTAVASGLPGTAVAAEDGGDGTPGLLANFETGFGWASVYRGQKGQSWTDLGFITRSQGVAVATQADPRGGALLMTTDGGHSWKVVSIR